MTGPDVPCDRSTLLVPWALIWAEIDQNVRAEVELATQRFALSPRALLKLVLLHLPRFTAFELRNPRTIREEAERCVEKLRKLQREYRDWIDRPRIEVLSRRTVRLDAPPESIVHAIHKRFHYLGSARTGLHFGLYHSATYPDLPMCVATLSPLDVKHLRDKLPAGAGRDAGWVLSRVFAFDWAPRNTISALLGPMCRSLGGQHPRTGDIFTYVNPNLGFTGASYRAANWREDGDKSIMYRYVHGDYVTARQAFAAPAAEITNSRFSLLPLRIWRHSFVDQPEQ